MSVNLSDRTLSKIEVITQANRLYDELFKLTLRSFGLYSKNSPMRKKYNEMLKLDINSSYLEKLISTKQELIESLGSNLVRLVNATNSVYPRNTTEANLRLLYQNEAISLCSMIESELNGIAFRFDVDVNYFKEAVQALSKEEHLLKEWRKSDKVRFQRYFL